MKLVYPKTVEGIFNEIIKDENVRDYLKELNLHHFQTYIHSLNVCFQAIDMGKKEGYEDEDLVILGYCGLFHDIGKLYLDSELINKKYDDLNKEQLNEFRQIPRKAFLSLQNLNYDFVAKVVISNYEFNKKYHCPRRKERRNKRRGDSYDRRKFDSKAHQFAQIISIANLYENYVSINMNRNLNFSKINLNNYLQDEFTGDRSHIDNLMEKL